MKTRAWVASLLVVMAFTGCGSQRGLMPDLRGEPEALPVKAVVPESDAVFSDGFETYANEAAFEKVWSKDGAPVYEFDATFGRASNKSVKMVDPGGGQGATHRYYHDLPRALTPSDAEPVELSYDLHLDPAGAADEWKGAWQTVDIRGYAGGKYKAGDVTGVVSIGVARVSANPWSSSYFQSRIFNPPDNNLPGQYHTANTENAAPKRTAGWHTLTARIGATSTSVLVDGVPAGVFAEGIKEPLTSVVIGSGVGSGGHTMWCDNVVVRQRAVKKGDGH